MTVVEGDRVRQARDGDLAAFESLVRSYYRRLLGFALRHVSQFDAEEIVQETFLKAFGALPRLRQLERFRPWLFAICRNEIVNTIRSNAAGCVDDDVEGMDDLADDGARPTGGAGGEELLAAIARLGDRHKDVIRMRYFDGLSLRRIGSILGVREALVKSRLYEAREVLRRHIPSDSEAVGSQFVLMPLLKEAIMKSVELTKNAAFVLERLSLDDQMRICDAVLEKRRFDSSLVETILHLDGGTEILQGVDSHLDERELAAVLNFADQGAQARFLGAAEKRNPQLTVSLRRTMVLPELNPAENEALRLQSEVIDGCDDCILVSLAGYIDNTGYFTERFRAILAGGYTRLILDCAKLNFISSSGIGAFATLRNELSRKSGEICIVAMQAPLREVFQLLCIAGFFVFRNDREEALRWARESGTLAQPVPEGMDNRETRRYLIQLDAARDGTPLRSRRVGNDTALGFGYASMAKGMGGDYLGLRRLDGRHLGAIMSDASGRGKEAAHAMVEVAALSQSFWGHWAPSETPRSLEELAYAINDALYRETSSVTFAAYQVAVLDGETGGCWVVHAGSDRLRCYDPDGGELRVRQLEPAASAGIFSDSLVRQKAGFRAEPLALRPGEWLLLCNDGLEESHRLARDALLEPIDVKSGHGRERFGADRVTAIVAAVMSRGTYELVREHCGGTTRRDVFDFSGRKGTLEDAVLALAAVEEVFRLTPTPDGARIASLPPEVDRLLAECLQGYAGMFSRRVRVLEDAVLYGGFVQDAQYDDVALLGIGRKPVSADR
jgi:RNA polymerase sigma factor (sigma-70 family)/anti-anti-sigma factor